MKLIKVVKQETYKDSKNRKSYFAIQSDNGKIVPIKPIFDNGYNSLNFLCEKTIFEGSKDVK